MQKTTAITCLFLDVGGVLLTNGWDHHARRRAAVNFNLEFDEMDNRHHLNFATYEEGKITLQDYLSRTVFYETRPFTRNEFWEFMCAQSQPYPEMIELVTQLKGRYGLRIVAVSNEARELNAYRIDRFKLDALVDCFVSSSFIHLRKPDIDMFRLALDLAQTPPERIVYIENTQMFVQIAEGLKIRSILHIDYTSTCEKLALVGLSPIEGANHESR